MHQAQGPRSKGQNPEQEQFGYGEKFNSDGKLMEDFEQG